MLSSDECLSAYWPLITLILTWMLDVASSSSFLLLLRHIRIHFELRLTIRIYHWTISYIYILYRTYKCSSTLLKSWSFMRVGYSQQNAVLCDGKNAIFVQIFMWAILPFRCVWIYLYTSMRLMNEMKGVLEINIIASHIITQISAFDENQNLLLLSSFFVLSLFFRVHVHIRKFHPNN